jgi:hypothetical protein
LSADTGFAKFIINDTLGNALSRQVSGLLPITNYYWRVAASSAKSNGEFSPTRAFTTVLVPPDAPIPASPSSSANGLLPLLTLRWHPANLAARYRVQVSMDSPFLSTVVDDSTVVDTVAIVGPLHYLSKYYWRVQSVNAKGASAYSAVWTFGTIVEAPTQPELAWPPSASVDIPNMAILRWHPSIRAEAYRLQIATDAPFTTTVYDDSTISDTSRRVGPLESSKTFYWRVSAKNAGWTTGFSPVWSLTTIDPPKAFALYQNYPNPFNPVTTIDYELPYETTVTLTIYDMLGQMVVKPVDHKVEKAGKYSIDFDARHLASGAYFYRLTAGTYMSVKKFLVVR